MIDRTTNQPDGASCPIAVSARGLSKSFGDTHAVRDLSFDARAGEVTGLLGPNGAGKTTTIKMLTTLLSIDSGAASIVGIDVAQRPDAVRRVIGLAGQSAAVDEKLTARENLELFGRLYKIPSRRAGETSRLPHRSIRSDRLRRPGRRDLLGWPAPPARCCCEPDRVAAGAVSR